jgi:hypothetical protein
MIQGLITGIVNMAQPAIDAVVGVVKGAISAVANFGRSPWPVFIQFGQDMMAGLILGWQTSAQGFWELVVMTADNAIHVFDQRKVDFLDAVNGWWVVPKTAAEEGLAAAAKAVEAGATQVVDASRAVIADSARQMMKDSQVFIQVGQQMMQGVFLGWKAGQDQIWRASVMTADGIIRSFASKEVEWIDAVNGWWLVPKMAAEEAAASVAATAQGMVANTLTAVGQMQAAGRDAAASAAKSLAEARALAQRGVITGLDFYSRLSAHPIFGAPGMNIAWPVHLFHQGGVLPEDIVGIGRSLRPYALQQGETVIPRGAWLPQYSVGGEIDYERLGEAVAAALRANPPIVESVVNMDGERVAGIMSRHMGRNERLLRAAQGGL